MAGCRAQGETPGLFFSLKTEQDQADLRVTAYRLSRVFVKMGSAQVFVVILSMLLAIGVQAEEVKNWSYYSPYVPESKEYQFEIGSMWEEDSLYWMGFTYGQHLGRCMYSDSTKCQQYLDYHLGWGRRESVSNSMGALSLRWQYVKFPEPFSPSFRVLAGTQKIKDDERDHYHFIYGLGVGFTASLHKNFDMKIESRFGGGSESWSMVMLSFNVKIDHWVQDFKDKVQKLGEDTWDVSGQIIKGTVEAPGAVIDWLKATETKRED